MITMVLFYQPQPTKKIVLVQKNKESVNHSNVFSKNFKAVPKEISIRINN